MLTAALIAVWFFVGVAASLHFAWDCDDEITLGDLLLCPFYGVLMPVTLIGWMAHFGRRVVIWRRKC